VPRYIFHLRFRDGIDGLAVDNKDGELPHEAVLREHVLETARDLIRTHCTFEGTDEAGRRALTLPSSEAV